MKRVSYRSELQSLRRGIRTGDASAANVGAGSCVFHAGQRLDLGRQMSSRPHPDHDKCPHTLKKSG